MAVVQVAFLQSDFKQAASALLPPGEYWQYEKGDELDCVLESIATEFKTINDETQISILYSPDNSQTGWKLSDYQLILTNNNIDGDVYDDSSTPNVIYIDLSENQLAGDLMLSLDDYKLPHTAFRFQYNIKQTLHVACTRRTLQINHHVMRAYSFQYNIKQTLYVACTRRTLQINHHVMRA